MLVQSGCGGCGGGAGLGESCFAKSDCIEGAMCDSRNRVCVYPGPCSQAITDITLDENGENRENAPEATTVHITYDKDGYKTHMTTFDPGGTDSVTTYTWSEDRKQMTQIQEPHPDREQPSSTRTLRFNDKGQLIAITDAGSGNNDRWELEFILNEDRCKERMLSTNSYAGGPEEKQVTRATKCVEGLPVENSTFSLNDKGEDGELQYIEAIEFNERGFPTQIERTSIREGKKEPNNNESMVPDKWGNPLTRIRRRGFTTTTSNDGVLTTRPTHTTTYQNDYSCWAVEGNRVVYLLGDQEPNEFARAIEGRWTSTSDSGFILFEFSKGRVTMVKRGEVKDFPVRILKETETTMTYEIHHMGEKGSFELERVDDKTLRMRDIPKVNLRILIRE